MKLSGVPAWRPCLKHASTDTRSIVFTENRLRIRFSKRPGVYALPAKAIVIEDALAGVQAGRAGGFGLVIGVNRENQAEALRQEGADIVVADLAEMLSPEPETEPFPAPPQRTERRSR